MFVSVSNCKVRLAAALAGLLVILPQAAPGGFDLAQGVRTMAQLDEAVAQAAKEEKPLAFLYSDRSSRCGLCRTASVAVMREFRSRTVMVYVGPHELTGLNPLLQTAFRSEEAGDYLPMTVIADPEMDEILGIIPALFEERERRHKFREINRTLRDRHDTEEGSDDFDSFFN